MKNIFTVIALFIFTLNVVGQDPYFEENFEGSGLPMGWTIETEAMDGGFLFDTITNLSSQAVPLTGNSTLFAATNDDACNCDKSEDLLYTPVVDLTDATDTTLLNFDAWYLEGTYNGDTEVAKVVASTDGGTTWEDVATINGNSNGWAKRTVDLSAYNGDTLRIGFHYSDNNGWLYALAIDNISVEKSKDIDVRLDAIQMRTAGLTGTDLSVGGSFTNIGKDTITSVDITWSDGTNDFTENISGLSIQSFETANFTHDTAYSLPEGFNPIFITLSNPNGEADENPTNNTLEIETRGVTPAAGRKVVIEEGTGTWCQWCPRGEVFLGIMEDRYPDHFIGIAVHDGDPMTVDAYDDGLNINSFPNMSNERTFNFGFDVVEDVETRFLNRLVLTPPALVESGASHDVVTGDLTLGSQITLTENIDDTYRIAVVLTENGVTGTGSGYSQTNAYAGGANGPMGGYENLPAIVPASEMVYDRVGRLLLGGFNGQPLNAGDAGDVLIHNFATVNIPAEYDVEQMHVTTLLLNGSGAIVNANSQTLQEVLDNVAVNTNEQFDHNLAKVYPNPFSDIVNIQLNLEAAADVNVRVMNAVGQVVATQQYDNVVGNRVIPFNGAYLANGVYTIHMTVGDKLVTKKVLLQK